MWYFHVENVSHNTARSKTSCSLCNAFSYINTVQSTTGRRPFHQIGNRYNVYSDRSSTYRQSIGDQSAILIFFQIWAYFGFIGFNSLGSVATKSVAARSQSGCKVCVSIALDTVNLDIFVSLLFREMSISEFFARS